ncbi:DUF6250 domain-containing protein, partial [Puniceicoccaceae bacterium K14]|nr:DUF6250 domain-containing protein [Puniceicoccaceae bacterium K14]
MDKYCWRGSGPIRPYVLFIFLSALIGAMISISSAADPVVTGHLSDDWEVGELLYEDNFDDPSKWEIQIEESDSDLVPEVTFENGVMDMYIPSRGATAWLKEKFDGPVLVVYDVLTPVDTLSGNDIRVGDVNTFLHASDPVVEDRIFDDTFYTGQFGTYGKMNGYYASSGGNQNTTARLRRYPRTDLLNGNDISHLAMTDKDGQSEYLLTAGQKHGIQMASVGGHVQYVFDGQIVYELKEGDIIFREDPGGTLSRDIYDYENYPEHTSGYFGFRMLRAHHQYSVLKVYGLKRVERTDVSVSTLAELRTAVTLNNQNIVMQAGDYDLETGLTSSIRNIICSGNNNRIDLTGVYINVPVGSVSENYIIISGDDNVWIGGEIEDTYRNGLTEITDFSAYNQDRDNLAHGLGGDPVMRIEGNGNLVEGIKLTVRGSFPYGYGSIFGIGADNVYGLDKRCGILITGGSNNTLDSVEVQQRAFGHAIFIQSGADGSVIKNSLVEGRVRPFAELYSETEEFDLPFRSDYKLPLSESGEPIPMDEVTSLCEDGYRMYNNTGSIDVVNCTAKKMRGGIRLYLGGTSTVLDSTAIDCGDTNFNMSNGGTIVNSSGNFAYAPLSDFRLSRSNMDIEWTIIPSPHAVGPHNLCDVLGNGHTIVF